MLDYKKADFSEQELDYILGKTNSQSKLPWVKYRDILCALKGIWLVSLIGASIYKLVKNVKYVYPTQLAENPDKIQSLSELYFALKEVIYMYSVIGLCLIIMIYLVLMGVNYFIRGYDEKLNWLEKIRTDYHLGIINLID